MSVKVEPSVVPTLVSVCMPAYNHGRYVAQAIQSVFAQTYRHLELVIVDDGSTDDTAEVAVRMQATAPFPTKVLRGDHRGVAAALNQAVRAASGEWIAILSSDDYCRPDRVEQQLAAAGDDCLLVHSEYVCVDERGNTTGYDSSTDLPPATGMALRGLLLLERDVRSMTVMFRRSSYHAIGGYDESLPSEDWQSILRLARLGPIAHVDLPLVFRRVHTSNASATWHRGRKTFSFGEIGIEVLREVAPSDLSFDHLCVLHSAVVLRNALALGAFEKVWDGLTQCWVRFPSERRLLLSETLRGVPSFLWMHWIRERLPPVAVRSLLSFKAALRRRSRR